MAGKTKGRAPSSLSQATVDLTMTSMLAMPRLPAPTATTSPRLRGSRADPSASLTAAGMSSTRGRGKLCLTRNILLGICAGGEMRRCRVGTWQDHTGRARGESTARPVAGWVAGAAFPLTFDPSALTTTPDWNLSSCRCVSIPSRFLRPSWPSSPSWEGARRLPIGSGSGRNRCRPPPTCTARRGRAEPQPLRRRAGGVSEDRRAPSAIDLFAPGSVPRSARRTTARASGTRRPRSSRRSSPSTPATRSRTSCSTASP